jgi:hypothetical protein
VISKTLGDAGISFDMMTFKMLGVRRKFHPNTQATKTGTRGTLRVILNCE